LRLQRPYRLWNNDPSVVQGTSPDFIQGKGVIARRAIAKALFHQQDWPL